ncbi:MAG: Type 1 glutamine amidotransferase-like domain-containing protein [Patescibacteria group bacterium]|nr:Type 1 glutamine amidotransferase-like domain-containing protein [Patescibacteria group bacterium]
MQNVKNNRIYLSGGGNEKQSFPLDKFFFSSLSENGRFLYIPIALRGHELYPTAHLWMKSVLELHNRNDIRFETADDLSQYGFEDLKLFNGIYIGGGNTWSLMKELKDSSFSNALIQYIQFGGQVYGGSAGAIILGKRIDTHDDENKIEMKDVSGFGLLHNYSAACHFKDDQNDRFSKWAINNNLPIICLPEETGLIIKNDIASCVGTKPCTVYSSNGIKKDINPGESFNL